LLALESDRTVLAKRRVIIVSIFNNIKVMIGKYSSLVSAQVSSVMWNQESFCHIEEIDTINKTFLIHCRGVTMPISLTFDEIIRDAVMVSNLLPQHASLVGYYYGKHYNLINSQNSHNKISNFSFRDSDKRYKILFQSRDGKISYLDKVTKTTHAKLAISILAALSLIGEFDSVEACYIGMLGGIFVSERNKKQAKISIKHQLALVK
jgi:hypothetical protein